MSQSKTSQVIVENEFEGITLYFGYPSFDSNISPTSTKYNHVITIEQAQYIRDKLNQFLGEKETYRRLEEYELCDHCPIIKQLKKILVEEKVSK